MIPAAGSLRETQNAKRKTVVVGMSGGVDSSVAAALLIEKGFEVIGVSMNLVTCSRATERTCCAPSDRKDAKEVADNLGIKHITRDCRNRFKNEVTLPFVQEYLCGRTPSPCIVCNEKIKFDELIKCADELGADLIATGHYAISKDAKLFAAADKTKDQSYFLFRLSEALLKRTLFPLGELTKKEVREVAKKMGMKIHDKPESQEVCFVPVDDYVAFIEENAGTKISGPGNFVDMNGGVLGRHKGIHAYTIGQRRGLGFGVGVRQYVVKIDAAKNEVVLGSNDDLMQTEMTVKDVSWVAGRAPQINEWTTKVRSTTKGDLSTFEVCGADVKVKFKKPVRAIAPGQAAVFYDGDEVLGGGWIK